MPEKKILIIDDDVDLIGYKLVAGEQDLDVTLNWRAEALMEGIKLGWDMLGWRYSCGGG